MFLFILLLELCFVKNILFINDNFLLANFFSNNISSEIQLYASKQKDYL